MTLDNHDCTDHYVNVPLYTAIGAVVSRIGAHWLNDLKHLQLFLFTKEIHSSCIHQLMLILQLKLYFN